MRSLPVLYINQGEAWTHQEGKLSVRTIE
uniref:Uncharacterized protein n=1 Tax=Rhizophora mucronata TaxID=61149 RepID=A0A2P2QFN1_RHIMU